MQGVKEKKAGISEEGVTDKNKNKKKSKTSKLVLLCDAF